MFDLTHLIDLIPVLCINILFNYFISIVDSIELSYSGLCYHNQKTKTVIGHFSKKIQRLFYEFLNDLLDDSSFRINYMGLFTREATRVLG